MKTRVVNLHVENYDIYIGRSRDGKDITNTRPTDKGWLGNPFTVKEYGRKGAIRKYKEVFYDKIEKDETFRYAVEQLKGKILGCFCKPKACHGDVIVEYLEE
ncbi:hypothetical protein AKJ51_04185 [candidate division MSBL1 archaeon SCGC-AAA382A20]|uniref:DUF4326 domain-containing protein n=1 Tax=candidate division MSBL1 archaeon SCGC-AAA382A20 TaxID=1698280 RepID=A0A133VI40_9EURY|nr:hypothetical protein AKJ51_04185 [candidate division MSBL1 archaeon SCGC-AAA382A20]